MSFHEVPFESDDLDLAFSISVETIPLDQAEPRGCWNELLRSSVIVSGFPIPERSLGEVGLEIPLDIMASLGGISLAAEYDGGYVLKGHSIAFVPVERMADSVQWHLIHGQGSRIQYKDVADQYPKRLLARILDRNALSTTKAFLGWCRESHNMLGMPRTNLFQRCDTDRDPGQSPYSNPHNEISGNRFPQNEQSLSNRSSLDASNVWIQSHCDCPGNGRRTQSPSSICRC